MLLHLVEIFLLCVSAILNLIWLILVDSFSWKIVYHGRSWDCFECLIACVSEWHQAYIELFMHTVKKYSDCPIN